MNLELFKMFSQPNWSKKIVPTRSDWKVYHPYKGRVDSNIQSGKLRIDNKKIGTWSGGEFNGNNDTIPLNGNFEIGITGTQVALSLNSGKDLKDKFPSDNFFSSNMLMWGGKTIHFKDSINNQGYPLIIRRINGTISFIIVKNNIEEVIDKGKIIDNREFNNACAYTWSKSLATNIYLKIR